LSVPEDPRTELRSARFCTRATLRWIVRNRAYSAWHLRHYWRFLLFKLRNPHVVTRGLVFLDRGARISCRRGYGRLVLGRWVHVGAHTAIRCHEGTLTVGDKAVIGRHVSVNCYLDVEIGAAALVADHVYVSDFDHNFADVDRPIKDQGIAKSRVRIGPDVWLGTKATVLRGVAIGRGSVIGANSVVTRDVPPYSVAVGAPAHVVKRRARPGGRPSVDGGGGADGSGRGDAEAAGRAGADG
jgi:acetyltransferase-like isoleucine patch superfamily enzyme